MRKIMIIAFCFLIGTVSAQKKEIADDIYVNQSKKEKVQDEQKQEATEETDRTIVNSSETTQAQFIYCEIVGTSNLLGTKVKIQIDYGQEVDFFKQYSQRSLKDESGKAIKFNSMVDALNYMGSQGWEFVQAYAITIGNSNVYHFLLKMRM